MCEWREFVRRRDSMTDAYVQHAQADQSPDAPPDAPPNSPDPAPRPGTPARAPASLA
jgi:hypothetical protein